jgi:hypothetical protein
MLKSIFVQPFLDPAIGNDIALATRAIVRVGVNFPVYNLTCRIPTDLELAVISILGID